jgi:hypothetical protein
VLLVAENANTDLPLYSFLQRTTNRIQIDGKYNGAGGVTCRSAEAVITAYISKNTEFAVLSLIRKETLIG